MKVFLTHAYFIKDDLKEQVIVKPYPPLGLLYVSAYLKKHNVDTQVFDTTFSEPSAQRTMLLNNAPDVVGIYTNLMTKIEVIKLIKWVKAQTELAHTKLVLGGPDLTYNIENYLNEGADYLIIGEGEQTMLTLVNALKNHTPITEVNGLAFFQDGKLIQTAPANKLKSLNDLPWPDRDAIPLARYLDTWEEHHGIRSTNINTQRGCPYTCKWCSTAVYGQSYRRRPAEDVVREIMHLKEQHGVNAIWFVDDVFTVSHKWLTELHACFKRAQLVMPFECITRAERLTNEVLDLLKEMGCYRIWIGAESGSQQVIDAMDRRVDINHVSEMMVKTREKEMEAGTFVMVGYPNETLRDIRKTYAHLRKALPSEVTVTQTYPIKGTALYHELEGRLQLPASWASSTDREIKFKRTYSNAFYPFAIRYIMNGYYAKKYQAHPGKWLVHSLKSKAAYFMMLVVK